MIELTVNGVRRQLGDDGAVSLLHALRETLDLRGTRIGCGEGECGACQVLMDGRSVASCITPLAAAAGTTVVTAEGLGAEPCGRRLRDAFVDEQAAQCGYCTSGMLIGAAALLREQPQPSAAEVRRALDGHLCRCGAHPRIVRAVLRAAAGATG